MEFSYQQEDYSSEEIDRSSEQNNDDDMMGIGRSYECVFCKRGFTTAQALGGHMNIHRKDRANNNKTTKVATPPNYNFPPSSSAKVVVDDDHDHYSDLGFYNSSPIPRGGYYSTAPDHHHHGEVDYSVNNYHHQICFPSNRPSHHVQYGEVLCVDNQLRDNPDQFLFGSQDHWRQRGLSLYSNPLCAHENKDKNMGNHSEEDDDLDLELRLGHYP